MNTTMTATKAAPLAHSPLRPALVAKDLAADFALRAGKHDTDDSFVSENYQRLRDAGLIAAGVPRDLGGGGADVRELCTMLRLLAHGCGATAIAFAMHTHQVAIPAWRWQHQAAAKAAVEPLLRRVAAERLILLTSGGSDWVGGSGRAEPVEGGFRIYARKMFASGAPIGNLLITGAVVEEGDARSVVHFAVPLNSPEVHILDTWHTLGMRGTGSHDVEIDGLFIPDDKISLKRKAGEWHPVFQIIATIAFPLIYSAYLGVAESARDRAIALVAKGPPSGGAMRLAGQMDTALHAARLAHDAMIDAVETNAPSAHSVNLVMMGRRLVEDNAIRTVDLAMQLAGGAGFYRHAELERCFRDIQAARYHPRRPEAQFTYSGAMALAQPVANIF